MEEVKLNEVQVRANTVITTACRFFKDKAEQEEAVKSGKILMTPQLKNLPILYQKVTAVGPVVHDVKVGDIIKINPLYYLSRKLVQQRESLQRDVLDVTGTRVVESYSELDYTFPTIELHGEEHLLLFDRDVEYIIKDGTAYGWKVNPTEG